MRPGHQEPDPPEAPAHGAVQACAAHGCADGDAALLAQFAALGRLRPLPPGDAAVQRQVERLRCYISSNYFSCTLDVFESLGGLYASDAFSGTIDGAGGAGTAAFIAAAISAYCRTAARPRLSAPSPSPARGWIFSANGAIIRVSHSHGGVANV